MKQVKTLGLIIAAAFVMASCGNSKKDGDATITDIKAKLEKAKKTKEDNEAEIKKLEADLLRLDTNTANAAKIKLVSVIPVAVQKFEHYIDLQGKVDAENISYIAPRSTGMGAGGVVKAVYVQQGQAVKKGQLLLKLDDALLRQQVAAAKQQAEVLKTQLSLYRTIYQRKKNLWDQGIGGEVDVISAKASADGFENQLAAANQQARVAEEQLSTANVYSDVNGIADQVNIKVGEMFSGVTAAGPQIKIVNTSNLKIVTNVPENYITRMHTGTPVMITIPDAQKENIPTTISVISQSVDATMRGFTAEAKIPYNVALKPNQTAIMRIKDYSAEKAIVIPVNMIQTDETGKYVFVMSKASNGKTTAHRITVVVGEVYGDNAEIKSGLSGGEQLITEGYQSLYEGQVVSTGIKA